MAHGPYWEDLPVDANGRRYVVPTKWNQLVDNILNWQADRDAGGYALNNLGVLSFASTGYVSGVRVRKPGDTTGDFDHTTATVFIQDSMGEPFNGGAAVFGAPQGYFAGIKGLLRSGNNNTIGDLVVSTRRTTSAPTLTETMRWTAEGRVGIGVADPKSNLHVVGLQNYADNAAAIAAGLTAGAFYHTNGALKVVI